MKNLRMRLAIARQPLDLWLYSHITYFLAVKSNERETTEVSGEGWSGLNFFVSSQKSFELAVLEE